MTQPVANLRVRRTQKLLREALIDLIEERGFESLTVGEITERAMVSRAAFYRNYQDKYDLVEQIFAEAMQALLNAVSKPETAHSSEIWVRFFEHISEYDRLYRALLGRKGSPWFVLKMRASLVDLLKEFERFAAAGRPIYPAGYEFVPDLLAAMMV
ncbi:MAG TPA: TetR/AcrR family transcriptional regulator, partial [Anaerolineales bacterium]|nr:TetR/AcrR family transcriptional regulator [Anaerolineales bacterium]